MATLRCSPFKRHCRNYARRGILTLSALYTSESDVYRRQILTSQVGPRIEKIQIFIMAVDR